MIWEKIKIDELKSEKKYSLVGGPFGSDLTGKHYVEFGVPVIRGTNLPFNKNFSSEDFVYVSEEKANKLLSNTAYPGDIIFTQRGTLGQVGIVPFDKFDRYIVSQSQMKLTIDNSKAVPLFIYYYFKTKECLTRIDNLALSSGVPHINLGILKNFKVPYPPLPIQQKIASILSSYDELIENNKKRIKLLETMAEEIYREWFVRLRFPGYDNTKIIDGLPVGWNMKSVFEIIKRYPAGKKYDNNTALNKGNVPILDQGQSGLIGYHNDEPSVFANMDDPIIIFANHTCYQRLIQFNFSAIQNILPFKSNDEYKRNIYWLHFATKDIIEFNDYKGHWPEFSNKKIVLPDEKTAKYFGDIIKPMINEIYLLVQKNQLLQETLELLLPRLISGKLSVEHLVEEELKMVAEPKAEYSKSK
jgi:type I restriction enzyme S subunit